MKNCYLRGLVFPLWCLSQSAAFADQFQDQLLQAGVSQEAVDTLVQHKYSKVEDLKSLTFEKLLQMGVKGKSALQIVEKFIYIQESASVKPLSSTTPPATGQALKNRMDEILAMQKDLYEKTVEFNARRQGEIDKLTQQVQTAAQQGDIAYQAAIATIKSYDADTERLDFEIEWLDTFRSLVEGTTEMTVGSTLIVPKEARTFPLGKQFPLFASVSWKDNGLYRAQVWLGNAGKTYLGFSPFRQVSAGWIHTCGLRTDGTVVCWGNNNAGQSTPPTSSFSQVSARETHTCGLRTDGTVACWGHDSYGQSTPPIGSFSQVSAGVYHTCGLRMDGTVACWGFNGNGQSTPPPGNFSQISAGKPHTCGVRTDGTVVCWGNNIYEQPPTGSFSQISAGDSHTCGLHTDGKIACWGNNHDKQSTPPTGSFSQVSAGSSHTCALRTDGTVACWGDNSDGQSTPPTGTFLQISAGDRHTCGVRTDGTVACWGNNDKGQSTPPVDK